MIPIENKELLKRIKEKLDRHDKSLFTAGELNLLRDIIKNMPDKFEV